MSVCVTVHDFLAKLYLPTYHVPSFGDATGEIAQAILADEYLVETLKALGIGRRVPRFELVLAQDDVLRTGSFAMSGFNKLFFFLQKKNQ